MACHRGLNLFDAQLKGSGRVDLVDDAEPGLERSADFLQSFCPCLNRWRRMAEAAMRPPAAPVPKLMGRQSEKPDARERQFSALAPAAPPPPISATRLRGAERDRAFVEIGEKLAKVLGVSTT
jgi:hypothetical protein